MSQLEAERSGHGWWPYIGPYFAFLLIVQVGGEFPESWLLFLLLLKLAVPAGLMISAFVRGVYPELRGYRVLSGGAALDVLVGLASALLWVVPYLLIPALSRPGPGEGFDPTQAGEALIPVTLSLRMLGYGLVTPFFEELFIRSFVMRYSDVYDRPVDFRDVPIARYTARSFWITVVVFTAGHVPWEWWVAIPWAAVTNLWFYHRRHVMAVVVVHAVANASILVAAIAAPALGIDLWYFV